MSELQKHTLNLRAGDWDALTLSFKPKGIDTSHVIRMIVSNFVNKLENEQNKIATPEIELENDDG